VTPTDFDPALILGCTPEDVADLMRGHVVTPGEVEGVALRTYQWRAHRHDPGSYWVTVGQAAEILDLSLSDTQSLLDHHRLPYCRHADGVRLIRRHQLEHLHPVP
jgi:hypothetical protein